MRRLQLWVKRGLDVGLCLVILLLGWPLLILIAVVIKLTSPGPVLFIQERVGLAERPFCIYKFRTMAGKPSGASAKQWTVTDEVRITSVGRFLRDYGLDELPQVFNILKGEMSIVGPRPPLPASAAEYTPRQRIMFRMRPGVLSLAAVEGRRSIPMEQRIALHVRYVKNWSLALDFRIIWQALFVVLARRDAVEVVRGWESRK